MEKFLDSMVIVARGASRNVRMFPLTVLFTFTMVIIINCILQGFALSLLRFAAFLHKGERERHAHVQELL